MMLESGRIAMKDVQPRCHRVCLHSPLTLRSTAYLIRMAIGFDRRSPLQDEGESGQGLSGYYTLNTALNP